MNSLHHKTPHVLDRMTRTKGLINLSVFMSTFAAQVQRVHTSCSSVNGSVLFALCSVRL